MGTGKLARSISTKLHSDNVSWSEDSRRVYLNAVDPDLKKTVIACWDAGTGQLLSKVPLEPEPGSSYGRAFSRDTHYFAVLYPDQKLLHLYDTRSGQLVGTAKAPLVGFSLSFSPHGRKAACSSQGEVILYTLPDPPAAKDKP